MPYLNKGFHPSIHPSIYLSIMSRWRLGGNFAGSGFSFHVICIFSLCIARSSFMEKSKTERSPWIKSTKKPGPKKKKRKGFAEERNKSLAESDKGSWFGQAPLSTSTDEHERSDSAGSLSSVGASRLKIKAFDNATYYGGSSSESDETDDGEFETSDTKYRSIVNRQLAGRVTCSFCGSEGINFEEVTRTGLGAEWICRCKNPECSSHELASPFHTTPKTNRFYDINRELVLGLRLTGRIPWINISSHIMRGLNVKTRSSFKQLHCNFTFSNKQVFQRLSSWIDIGSHITRGLNVKIQRGFFIPIEDCIYNWSNITSLR